MGVWQIFSIFCSVLGKTNLDLPKSTSSQQVELIVSVIKNKVQSKPGSQPTSSLITIGFAYKNVCNYIKTTILNNLSQL